MGMYLAPLYYRGEDNQLYYAETLGQQALGRQQSLAEIGINETITEAENFLRNFYETQESAGNTSLPGFMFSEPIGKKIEMDLGTSEKPTSPNVKSKNYVPPPPPGGPTVSKANQRASQRDSQSTIGQRRRAGSIGGRRRAGASLITLKDPTSTTTILGS